jgi:1-acyl-sn-glycerol-3-phosphate acyltransferase
MLLWRLRVLIFYFLIVIVTAIAFCILLVIHLLNMSYDVRYLLAKIYSHSFIKILEVICGIGYKVEGQENIPNQSCVIALNHQSFWDNIIVVVIFPKQSWVMKRELFQIPFFGWGLKMMDTIAIDRGNDLSVSQILKKGSKKLSSDISVIIFPEGTRLNYGESRNLRPSFAKLASMNNVDILPVVHNAGLYWPKGFWMKKSGIIKIKVGLPISTSIQDDPREITKTVQDWINHEKDRL